jgi:osmotically-inducible protein OsmY
MYYFDPQRGRRRRAMSRDRAAGALRRNLKRSKSHLRGIALAYVGKGQRLAHIADRHGPFDDATLADKVQSEVFRDHRVPKGHVNVNAERGVVYLRGEVPTSELIERLESATRRVAGVVDVENRLHLPGERAPTAGTHTPRR